jgi:hypothetical protein
MRRVLVLLLASAAALVVAAPASAKWCARISVVPARPAVGQTVTLRLRTFEAVMVSPGRAGPGKPTRLSRPQMLLVTPPRGEFRGVEVRRRRDPAHVWEARYVFRRAGTWSVRYIDETPLGIGCRGRITVRVLPRR